jgi:hypothetical protein
MIVLRSQVRGKAARRSLKSRKPLAERFRLFGRSNDDPNPCSLRQADFGVRHDHAIMDNAFDFHEISLRVDL